MIQFHKRLIKLWQKKFNISDYAVLWLTFVKGIFVGLIFYHFFFKS